MQKLFAGAKLRETRGRIGLSQKDFAAKLGVSLPYLNQMENNNRPISTTVLLALAQEFGFDVTELSNSDSTRLISDMKEALADPVFAETQPSMNDLRLLASNAPGFARAFLDLHKAYRQNQERLASLDEALGQEGQRAHPSPWEEVRDFFHYCNNYIDAVDRAAEQFAMRSVTAQTPRQMAKEALEGLGVRVAFQDDSAQIRGFDTANKVLSLSALSPEETQTFQMLLQYALLTQENLLEATLDLARLQTQGARDIAKIGLANYFAGAALMPYQKFLATAQETRHDLDRLSRAFGASIEQVAHRLSTLQRAGAQGVPFFFVRVDQAGTITKRHSATHLQFARFGGACPLWNVHQAFETPGRFLRQLAETPDGVRYISIAREITKSGGHFGAPVQRYAIALGCEVRHADKLVYADGLDYDRPSAFEPIGISCRLCDRPSCHQRSVPPLERRLSIDTNQRHVLPYSVG